MILDFCIIANQEVISMKAYSEVYLDDVVENQGKLFDLIAQKYPNMDTENFINTYMASKTRKAIDNSQAYVNTMDAVDLWNYFTNTENYKLKPGEALKGFFPKWIGEFYAYYQWYYNVPSIEVVQKLPINFLKKSYQSLSALDLELAVQKMGLI